MNGSNTKFFFILMAFILNKLEYINIDINVLLILLIVMIMIDSSSIKEHMSINQDLSNIASLYNAKENTIEVNNIKAEGNITAVDNIECNKLHANENISFGENNSKWIIYPNSNNKQLDISSVKNNDIKDAFSISNKGSISISGGKYRIGEIKGSTNTLSIGTPQKAYTVMYPYRRYSGHQALSMYSSLWNDAKNSKVEWD